MSLRTDYALRMLMTLAHAQGLLSVDQIARRHGISRNHLAKVAQQLAALDLIESVRGRGGGVRLAKAPEDINVGAVVRVLERQDNFVECLGGQSACALAGHCGLTPVLSGALDAFFVYFDQFSLAQISWGKARIRQLLEDA